MFLFLGCTLDILLEFCLFRAVYLSNTFYFNPLSLIPPRDLPWNVRYFPLPAFVLIWPPPSNYSPSRILCSFFPSISNLHFASRILRESFSRRRCLISASEKSSRRARILSSPPYEPFFRALIETPTRK